MLPGFAFLLLLAGAVLPAHTAQASDAALSACLRRLRAEAASHGVRPAVFDRHTKDARYDSRRALPDEAQPEFTWPIREYLGVLVDEQRIEDGRRLLQEQAAALATIERRLGVDAATVVAIFGVETDFGAFRPKHPVIETFVNRACGFPAASPAFRREQKAHLFQSLKMLQAGDVRETEFFGSRAGAFGMTQFMPLTYAANKVDVDGDGRADIVNSVPDALGATARFLVRSGWRRGRPWAMAVELPPGFDTRLAASGADHARLARGQRAAHKRKTVAQWRRLGLRLAPGRKADPGRPADAALLDATPASLLLPEGPVGPAFLVTGNFVAFWRYNNSDAYAFAVGLLADALRGDAWRIDWASEDAGLSRRQVAELQSLLAGRGHAGLSADGVPGSVTREAVRAEQRRLGWPETGHLGRKLLDALRASAP